MPLATLARRLGLALLALPAALAALAAQSKPLLTPAAYGRFEALGAQALAPDGRTLAYAITRTDESRELRVRPLAPGRTSAADSTRVLAWGSAPRFSNDSRWLAWTINPTTQERAKLEKEKKPVRLRAGVLDLKTGAERTFDAVRATAFDASGRFLALHGYAPDEPKGKGADVRVLDLAAGTELTLGNVSELAWSDTASLLAATIATGTAAGNGVQLYDAASGRLVNLDGSGSAYRQLAWRKQGTDLAVLRSVKAATTTSGGRQLLLAWRALDRAATPTRLQLDSVSAGLSDTLEIVEHYRPRWSDDGRLLAVGLRPRARADSARRDSVAADSLPTMQIWHPNDVQLVPQQQAQAQQRAQRTLLAVWNPAARRVVQVGTSLPGNAQLLEGWRDAIESADAKYAWGAKFGRRYQQLSVVDVATGARRVLLDSVRYVWPSAAGRYVLSFDGKDYWTDDLRTGTHRNVTRGVAASFADTTYDTPTDVTPPVGVAGWTDGDRALLLYDQYDVWRVAPDGSAPAVRLTRGREDSVTHRLVRVDTARRTFDPAAPIYVTLHGEWSERRGLGRILPNGSVERPVYLDKWLGALTRAAKAQVFAYSAESRDDSPDVFVGGPTLRDAAQVTRTNPFLGDYAWTREELVAYTSERGAALQGVLLYPANYDASKKYPMIVYAYEQLSQDAHLFQPPSERSYYNMTVWTEQGYFVLMPDIVFRAREPGVSTVEAVRPAVQAVVARGLVDGAKVGFIGHSFGGYHAAYLATHTKGLFAAAVGGAAITDLSSFMGQLHWTPGNAELDHYETGQMRMEVPNWEDEAAAARNSPITTVQTMTTPLLLAHGNEDGVVEFRQATELFNYARRAGKQVVLLVYEGENHGFTKKPNQIDYHRRILEWFGHYLKGEPAAAWITSGVAFDDMPAEKRRVARPSDAAPRTPPR